MIIEKTLPFDECENCKDFIMDVNEQTMSYADGGSHLVLMVRCKNANKCKRPKMRMESDAGEV